MCASCTNAGDRVSNVKRYVPAHSMEANIMKIPSLLVIALLALGGCASVQEPAKIVEPKPICDACERQLEALRTKSAADLDACNKALKDSEDCYRQKDVLTQKLQSAQDIQAKHLLRLNEQDAELARCKGETETTATQLQRMKDLEARLRDRLQGDISAKNVEINRLRSQLSVRVLDKILFETSSAEILPQGLAVLDTVASALVDGDETIRIEGHTDTVPIGPVLKRKYFSNWELSGGRAASVVRYLQFHHGIAPTRMEAVGFSKYRPVASNDTEEDRQRNRRVEIVLTPWKPLETEAPRN